MQADRKSTKSKITMILKRIFGILVGLIVSATGMIVLGNEKSLIGWLAMWYIPLLIGGGI
ncbi:MAG: hypothetical protein ACFFDT_34925 [Candidatus Hodarchaeota archaeon]